MFSHQKPSTIHCEWGGAVAWLSADMEVTVIVDVLSFSTAVDAAVSVGAMVYPFAWRDQRAQEFADRESTRLAHRRQDDGDGPALSPLSLLQLQAGERLVLPSPNGSHLSSQAKSRHVFAACLRNYKAVAEAVQRIGGNVLVLAAGERWPDDSLRPALEDWLGAGALISEMTGQLSIEAEAARDAYLTAKDKLQTIIKNSHSGRELIDMGFGQDAEFACQVNSSQSVPKLIGGIYRNQQTTEGKLDAG